MRTIHWAISVFVLALVTMYIHLSSGVIDTNFLYCTDNLVLPAFFMNLMEGGGISGWKFPPHLFIFPDFILYFAVNLLVPNVSLALCLFGFAQTCLFALGLYLIARRTCAGKLSEYVFIILPLMFIFITDRDQVYTQYFFLNSFHFGVVISMLYSCVLVLRFSEDPAGAKGLSGVYWALYALVALTAASDYLYYVQFCAPMIVCLLIRYFLTRSKRAWSCACCIATASVTGYFVNAIFVKFKHNIYSSHLFEADRHWRIVNVIMDNALHYIRTYPVLGIGVVLVYAFSVFVLVRFLLSKNKVAMPDKLFMMLFMIVSTLGSFSAAILFLSTEHRHLIPVFLVFPIVLLLFLADESAAVNRLLSKNIVIYAGLVLILLLALPSIKDVRKLARLAEYYPDYVKCIDANADKYKLGKGLANFDQAMSISLFSKNNIRAAQVGVDLSRFHHGNNLSDYEGKFDFILAEDSNYRLRYETTGLEYEVVPCGRDALVVLKSPYVFDYLTDFDLYKLKKSMN